MTNFERIKQMEAVELAWELHAFRFDGFCHAKGAECILPNRQYDIVEWLKSEVKEVKEVKTGGKLSE